MDRPWGWTADGQQQGSSNTVCGSNAAPEKKVVTALPLLPLSHAS